MKTFDRKEVFSWANCEEATLNTWGYFSESLKDLKREIKEGKEHKLLSIDSEDSYCFKFVKNDTQFSFPFFLPTDKVKEVKKEEKYRPFKTLEEFRKTFNQIDFGQPLQIRHKENINEVFVGTFNGYQEEDNVLITISLGGWLLSPRTLFDFYEVFNEKTEEWQPFGVEK